MTVQIDIAQIQTLVESWGPPGYEHHIRETIRTYAAPYADDIQVDRSGALVCRIRGATPDAKKVMIAAHMDEIGFFVHHLDKEGFARFSLNGALFPMTLWGGRVRFENGAMGVIGLDDGYKPAKVPTTTDFYIDFSSGATTHAAVRVGDVGAMQREMVQQGDRLIAKSMDDRIGCVVALHAMRDIRATGKAPANDLYFVFTTQEEVGLRGARTSAAGINADYGVALDVTACGDVPKMEKLAVKLGHGVAIKVRDVGHIVPPALKDRAIAMAEQHGIPYQLEILDMGTTDAAAMQMVGAGIPAMALSIPCRGVHTVSEMVDLAHLRATISLLTLLLDAPFGE